MAEAGAIPNAETDAADAAKYKDLKTAAGRRPRFFDEEIAAARLSEQKAISFKERQIIADRTSFQPPRQAPAAAEEGEAAPAIAPSDISAGNPGTAERIPGNVQTENALGALKSQEQNKKPGANDQAKDAIKDIAVKQIKKRFALWTLSAAAAALPWLLGALLICLIIFAAASVYMCAEKKGWIGTLWDTSFGANFVPLLEESFNGTCLADTTPAPKTTDSATSPAQSSIAPGETAP